MYETLSESMNEPSKLNAVARLVLAAHRCGPQLLDNRQGFDSVFGTGSFALTNSKSLDEARRVVKSLTDRGSKPRLGFAKLVKHISNGDTRMNEVVPLLIVTDAGPLIIPADHIETVLKVLRALDNDPEIQALHQALDTK